MVYTVFFILGLIMALNAVRAVFQVRSMRRWPSAAGTITTSTFEESSQPQIYRYSVIYTYKVFGEVFDGSRVTADAAPPTLTRRNATDLKQKYREGAAVNVYYDPADPKESTLEPTASLKLDLVMGFSGLCLAGGVAVAYLLETRI